MPPSHPQLVFGLPSDPLGLGALGVGLLLLALATRKVPFLSGKTRVPLPLLLGLAGGSAALSLLYFDYYLRGAPRVIDATAYLLEARILETLSFTFTPPEPTTLFRGRFLTSPPDAPNSFGVLFPPGYPALLAVGEALATYRVVGPLLAALLVFATSDLAHLVTKDARVGVAAGALSVASMAVHYHTAEPMSHGWSALLLTTAASSYFRLLDASLVSRRRGASALLLGLTLGWLIATRQLTGLLALTVFAGHALTRGRGKWRAAPRTCSVVILGMFPGLVLLGLHQKALTGSFFGSPQLAYYAASDGPLGCFGLGLGKGCEFEHGDFFRATEGAGLTLGMAAKTTLRRLSHHTLDVANFEPLALVAALGLGTFPNRTFRSWGLALVAAFLGGYATFYFDGSIPGGGARFFFELLPLEHIALATLLVRRDCVWLGFALSVLGFALHGRGSHEFVDRSQGGAPYLTASELPLRDGVPRLVWVESDHAFLLGLVPRNFRSDGHLSGTLVARATGDLREQALERSLERSNEGLEVLRLEPRAPVGARLRPGAADGSTAPDVLEAETLWPALRQSNGWVHPSFPPESCASRGRALVIHPGAEPGPTSFELWVDGPAPGRYRVKAHFVRRGLGCSTEDLGSWELPGPVQIQAKPVDFGSIHLDRLEVSSVSDAGTPRLPPPTRTHSPRHGPDL